MQIHSQVQTFLNPLIYIMKINSEYMNLNTRTIQQLSLNFELNKRSTLSNKQILSLPNWPRRGLHSLCFAVNFSFYSKGPLHVQITDGKSNSSFRIVLKIPVVMNYTIPCILKLGFPESLLRNFREINGPRNLKLKRIRDYRQNNTIRL